MSDFQTSTLEDMCELVVDCPHFTPKWTTEGFVVIRNQNIRNGRLDLSNTSFTYKEDFERRITRAKPQEGDIIFTREAPMGEVCAIPEGLECCLGQRQVLLRPKVDIDGKYLLFALQSPYVRHQIFWNEGTGSTVSNVRIPVLKALKIPRQPNEKAIAHILGTLDDKIELNRRTNETLEAMAKAIFKDWFVDFGPTRAKMEGRAPYLPEELWSLFPGAIDDETGLPQGWEERILSDLCSSIKNGGTPSRSKAEFWNDGTIPWFKTGELTDSFLLQSSEKITPDAVLLSNAKVFPENTVVMAIYAAPTVGRLGILTEPSTFNQACTGLIPNTQLGTYFLYLSLYFGREWFNSRANGAAQQNISKAIVEAYKAIVPDTKCLDSFNKVINPSFLTIKSYLEESRTLAELRDRLLPKLMSGEIRVKDAEKAAEEVI